MKTFPLLVVCRSPLRRSVSVVLMALALAWFALSPTARAQLSPVPDGGYPNGNTAEGNGALFNLTTGSNNTAIGNGALLSNTTGRSNTAIGGSALVTNTTGFCNTATGDGALHGNTTGHGNTANGFDALSFNTTGNNNTADGVSALVQNTTGSYNTANGADALGRNSTGNNNTANGAFALQANAGNYNTANGAFALQANAGNYNTADGFSALASNFGNYNTAGGINALHHNTSGDANTANGVSALFNNSTGSSNTAIGILALQNNTTGSSNIALGFNAGSNLTTGSNNIDIGNVGIAGEGNNIRIGTNGTHTSTFIAGIRGVTVASGVGVVVGSTGQLGTVTSSARFKTAIKPMDKASEAILALKPVTFRYKEELDPDRIPQFGLVAEEVETVNSDLVVRDDKGNVTTVRYEAVNAMLLNEFLKEHKKVEEQGAMIAKQQKQIEALTATVQKVSDQVALSKPAPPLVANP